MKGTLVVQIMSILSVLIHLLVEFAHIVLYSFPYLLGNIAC